MLLNEVVESKTISPENLEAFGDRIRKEGKTLVTLNGSFDLLHPGHLQILYEAASQADVLLVLLNTDASIQQNKGQFRPINPLSVRLQNMAALEIVDYVSFFEEANPIAALNKIKPNVHVNGSEYGEDCIEAETVKTHGGRIHIVQLIHGHSSTSLIKKIKALCD